MTVFASYDGTRLHYTVQGDGPVVVCQPGGPGRASAYLEDLGGLAATSRLVLLDARGTGRSEVPADPGTMRADRLGDDLEALRGELGLERMVVLGHSAGAPVAMLWAAAHPDRVAALVLVTPSGRLLGITSDDVEDIRASRAGEPWYTDAAEAAADLSSAPPADQQRLVRRTRPFFYGAWTEREQAHAATAETQSSRRAEAAYGEGIDPAAIAEAAERLRRIEAPVLVVAGERDGITGVTAARGVAEVFADGRLVVLPEAGHFPWVDQPAPFRAAVAAFLAAVDAD
jgi:pimeloyl-ACP methyl ester carboxylesterase